MRHAWVISRHDVEKLRRFYRAHGDRPFVRIRRRRNVERAERWRFTKAGFWKEMVCCLLTTRQRSGPESAVCRFSQVQPFPLGLDQVKTARDVPILTVRAMTRFGGLRRAKTIGGHLRSNLAHLEEGGWSVVRRTVAELQQGSDAGAERRAATVVDDLLDGFGSKQARNLLQALGLTMYEIPLDSRVTGWLNNFGFPVKLSAAALVDRDYYCFVLDGLQDLCSKAGIEPCLLDAAIFASGGEEWSEELLAW